MGKFAQCDHAIIIQMKGWNVENVSYCLTYSMAWQYPLSIDTLTFLSLVMVIVNKLNCLYVIGHAVGMWWLVCGRSSSSCSDWEHIDEKLALAMSLLQVMWFVTQCVEVAPFQLRVPCAGPLLFTSVETSMIWHLLGPLQIFKQSTSRTTMESECTTVELKVLLYHAVCCFRKDFT